MLTVESEARDRSLLTIAELRAAVGEEGTTNDADLKALCLQISDAISLSCGVVSDGVYPPTLLSEDLSETIRLSQPKHAIALSRRFITAIAEVTIGGTAIASEAYEIDRASGIIRLFDVDTGSMAYFPSGQKLVFGYTAGFEVIPPSLKLAAKSLVCEAWAVHGRDPLLRQESWDGLGSAGYFKSAIAANEGWPKAITEMLTPFKYVGVL